MTLTRSRKARILEKAGLRYVAGWLPVKRAVAVQDDIELAQESVTLALSTVRESHDADRTTTDHECRKC
jgi:hypothetical protein